MSSASSAREAWPPPSFSWATTTRSSPTGSTPTAATLRKPAPTVYRRRPPARGVRTPHTACEANGLSIIYLLAPTSTDERVRQVAKLASGFIYCLSLTGVTGARDELPQSLPAFVERVRKSSGLPIAVGFGISQRKHFEAVGYIADAAVIGSAIVDLMDRSDPSQVVAKVKEYAEVVTGRRGRATA